MCMDRQSIGFNDENDLTQQLLFHHFRPILTVVIVELQMSLWFLGADGYL